MESKKKKEQGEKKQNKNYKVNNSMINEKNPSNYLSIDTAEKKTEKNFNSPRHTNYNLKLLYSSSTQIENKNEKNNEKDNNDKEKTEINKEEEKELPNKTGKRYNYLKSRYLKTSKNNSFDMNSINNNEKIKQENLELNENSNNKKTKYEENENKYNTNPTKENRREEKTKLFTKYHENSLNYMTYTRNKNKSKTSDESLNISSIKKKGK